MLALTRQRKLAEFEAEQADSTDMAKIQAFGPKPIAYPRDVVDLAQVLAAHALRVVYRCEAREVLESRDEQIACGRAKQIFATSSLASVLQNRNPIEHSFELHIDEHLVDRTACTIEVLLHHHRACRGKLNH